MKSKITENSIYKIYFEFIIKIIFITGIIFLYSNSFAQEKKYIDGNTVNYIDTNGLRQGLWIDYSFTIHSFYNYYWYYYSIGAYIDNHKTGRWCYFSNNGFLTSVELYKDDSTFYKMNYYLNNQIQSQGWYNVHTYVGEFSQETMDGKKIPSYTYSKYDDWEYYCRDGNITSNEDFDEIELDKYIMSTISTFSYDKFRKIVIEYDPNKK